jgi:hypothetical protein
MDTVDYNTTTTVDIFLVSNSDRGNQLNNLNQNTTSSHTQNTHTTMYNHAQQCNNNDRISHQTNNINNSNSQNNNDNHHHHNTAIYSSSRASNNGIQAHPTVQHSESNDYDTHR